jgi:hypothetical protein
MNVEEVGLISDVARAKQIVPVVIVLICAILVCQGING